ncbi:sensor domain-containing diguanylate cyclase [uncultured Methylobacterium sp.]|uniref:sensor domain-containing diguanylate cyclase n=1 Tax=uncultured Methylobacterium sp. TaxID=157278 RepID=UPI00260D2BB0|nr:sensor domain-containing diguanylate cyclase [uncultured Methylobacterium sp.]
MSLTATLCLASASAVMVLQMRHSAWDQVARTSQNLLEVTETAIDRNIELYDLSLRAVVDGLQNPNIEGIAPDLRHLILFDRSSTANGLGAILALDAQGDVFMDSASQVPRRLRLDDRDFFRIHKQRLDAGLYIGAPTRTQKDGRLVIPFSRRLTYADGTFAGVVVGAMNVSYLDALLQRLSIDPGSSVALFRTDGVMLARNPSNLKGLGENIAGSAHFHHYLEQDAGQFVATAKLDGIERFYTFSHVGSRPLILNVNVAVAAIQAIWWPKAIGISAVVLVLCLGLVGLTLQLQRELERRVHAERVALDANAELARLAATDGLTGLPNRRHFDAVFDQLWQRAERTGERLSLLLIDADRFKSYNDTYGHLAGDEVLKTIARCLERQVSGPHEVACRFGGEEFAVLLIGLAGREVVGRAEDIRQAVARTWIPHRGQDGGFVTVSIGVACLVPGVGMSPHQSFAAADAALYEAKRRGRDCVVCHNGQEQNTDDGVEASRASACQGSLSQAGQR